MDRAGLRTLLRKVRSGTVDVEDAVERIRRLPAEEMAFATLDLHRALRRGFPEAVYGAAKTPKQIAAIVDRMCRAGQTALVTRVGPEAREAVARLHPGVEYHEEARVLVVRSGRPPRPRSGVVVVTAGTSDLPVAEEAALTAELLGQGVVRVHDVGVAGLHRLLAHRETLTSARVIVAVAGMEGALPSVVAGLVDCPVVAVPTSTGYGTGLGGVAALLAMLNSCSPGVAVVNIDNGYGAGCLAALINGIPGRPPKGVARMPRNRRKTAKNP